MSILHSFPAVKKAAAITTHAQRLAVLKEMPVKTIEKFLADRSRESPSAGWMNTLTDVGMLDLPAILAGSVNGTMTEDLKDEWIRLAHFFMDFAGEPKMKFSKTLIGSDTARQYTVFDANDEMRDTFHRATERLVLQFGALKQLGVKIPALDSKEALSNKFLGVFSRWAGTACLLDCADTLKLLIDACPEAMSCSMSVDTRTLKVAQKNDGTRFQETAGLQDCRVAPFYCALQVGSTACMDAILDKRGSLGLTLNAPFSCVVPNSDRTSFASLGMVRGEPFATAMFKTDPVCSPSSFAHAIARIHPTLDATEQQFLSSNLMTYAQKHPHHFFAIAGQGFFHENDNDPKHRGMHARALTTAVMNNPDALPAFMHNVPWAHLRDQNSPFFRACMNPTKAQREPREQALLALIEQAKIDGQEDTAFGIDIMGFRGKKSQEPVTSLSENGFNKVMMKFLENGFNPNAKHPEVDLTLSEIADAEKHPTQNMLRSYFARTTAHRLIDEMDADAAPSKPVP